MAAAESSDGHPLTGRDRPEFEVGRQGLRLVDLFAGCGGLTLGVAQAAHRYRRATEIILAVDSDKTAAEVYRTNFPKASAEVEPVEALFNGALGGKLTSAELDLSDGRRHAHVLVGGPPCQGHSDLNNHTRRDDPKNLL